MACVGPTNLRLSLVINPPFGSGWRIIYKCGGWRAGISSFNELQWLTKSSKIFNIEDRKRQTGIAVSEVDVFQWKSVLLEELRKNTDFTIHLAPGATWGIAKTPYRGFSGTDKEDKAKAVDDLLTKIASVAPSCLVRSINKRTTSLEDILTLIKDWAGIQSTGSKHLDYYRVKKSWNENSDETRQEFFYRLKDSMEDTLVTKDDNISENGVRIKVDEDLTPCINSLLVMDWVEALGGPPLVEHNFRVYTKDLESCTLGSLQTRISKKFRGSTTRNARIRAG